MKRMDIFCASQASTAICLSMDKASCSSSNTIQLGGGRAIDRHNPIIDDYSRRAKSLSAPCSSSSQQPPINPKAMVKSENKKNAKKKKKNDDVAATTENNYSSSSSSSKPIIDSIFLRRTDLNTTTTPAGSTRCLLSDTAFFDDPVSALTEVVENKKLDVVHRDETSNTISSKSVGSSHPKSGSSHQVVVLRVSLNCKGCEGKVRKHLSRMQGVTSFNIDFAAKKVTVVGDVTPLSVLASISKVKSAQFWPAVGSGTIETKRNSHKHPN